MNDPEVIAKRKKAFGAYGSRKVTLAGLKAKAEEPHHPHLVRLCNPGQSWAIQVLIVNMGFTPLAYQKPPRL